MLSYQHGYHAGNPADVQKHLTLIAILQRMQAKESAIHYFDTHAGKGHYDLADAQAQKKGEFRAGVAKAINVREALEKNSFWADFFAGLDNANAEATQQGELHDVAKLRYYPGSPGWVAQFRRSQDRHTVFELHPAEHAALQDRATASKQLHTGRVVHGDGLAGVIQQLPPKTPRLLVLIDPAYENKTEYLDVAATAARIMQRCRHAVVLIWYPLLPAGRHALLLEQIQQQIQQPILQSEFCYQESAGERGMYGAGMLVVNPPWQLEQQLTEAMQPFLAQYGEVATYQHTWLVAE